MFFNATTSSITHKWLFFSFELLNIRSIQKRLCNSWFLHKFLWRPTSHSSEATRSLAELSRSNGGSTSPEVWGIQVASRLIVTGIAPLKHHPISTAYIQKKTTTFFFFGRKLGFQWRARAAFRVFFLKSGVDFSVAPRGAKKPIRGGKRWKNSEV